METSTKCLKVNSKLLPIKLHNFFFFSALACAYPFRTIIAKQLGLSATEIGIIFSAATFLRILTNPIFGFILDYFKKIRVTVSVIMIVIAIALVSVIFIPPKTSAALNGLNITENDFYTKVKYSCHNKTFPQVCDSKLLMYNEYRITTNSIKNSSSFTCDIQCSDSTNGIAINKRNDILQCSSEIRFEFKICVNVSSYNLDIQVKKGEMKMIVDDNVQNLVPINVNDSSKKQFKSQIPPCENCSIGITPLSVLIRKNTRDSSDSNYPDVVEAYDNGKKYVSISVPENVAKEKKIYFDLQEFVIDVPMCDLINNNVCSVEFDCKTIKCSSKFQQGEQMAEKNEFLSLQFWSLFILISISSTTCSALIFMMDAVCYELLQDKRHQYGKQRLFGTIGWGVGALVGGYMNQMLSSGSGDTDYSSSFYLLVIVIFIDLIPVNQLKVTDLKYSPHILKDVCFLFTKKRIIYNVFTVYIVGILSGFIWNYQFWFMQEIGSGQILLGLSQTFECIFELPCFVVSGWIISKIGHEHCNSITLLCFGLRYLCFYFMYDPWWTLAVALIHGPTFGLFYASMTMYAKNEAPPGTEATVQSVLHLSFEGLGVATGSILGGVGLDQLGSRMSFLYAAVLSALMMFINIFMSISFSRTNKKSKEIELSLSCS